MHKVLECLAKINRTLDVVLNTSPSSCLKVVKKLQEQLEKRTKDEEIPTMAAMLNPDTKALSFFPLEDQKRYHGLLLDKALELDANGKTCEG